MAMAVVVNPALWSAGVLATGRARRGRRLAQLITGQTSVHKALEAQFRYLRLRRRVQGTWLGGSLLLEGELVQLVAKARRTSWQRNSLRGGAADEARFRSQHALWQRELRTGEFLVAVLSPSVMGPDKGEAALKAFVADCHRLGPTSGEALMATYRDGPGFLTTHSLMESITFAECLPPAQWAALAEALGEVAADWRALGWLGTRVFETLLLAASLQEGEPLRDSVAQVRQLAARAVEQLGHVPERTAQRDEVMYEIRNPLLTLQRQIVSPTQLGWTGSK